MRAPVDVRRRGHRDAVRAQVALDEPLRPGVVEDLDLERGRVARDPRGRSARPARSSSSSARPGRRERERPGRSPCRRAGAARTSSAGRRRSRRRAPGTSAAGGRLGGRHATSCAPAANVRSTFHTTSPSGLPTRIVSVRTTSRRTRARPVSEKRMSARRRAARRGLIVVRRGPSPGERASPVRGPQVAELRNRRRGPGGRREAERGHDRLQELPPSHRPALP